VARERLVLNDRLAIESGAGGSGGQGGLSPGGTAGAGLLGGEGGAVDFKAQNVLVYGDGLSLKSGAAGVSGLAQGAAGGAGGQGGALKAEVLGDLTFNKDALLNLEKGSANASKGGDLDLSVAGRLTVVANKRLELKVAGPLTKGPDQVKFNVLRLEKDATFLTTARVGAASGAFYEVKNFEVVAKATWLTNGQYKPDNQGQNDYVSFNQKDIAPNGTMVKNLDQGYAGRWDLSSFDPVKEQAAYLVDPKANPAFISSPYQTKPLRLGDVVLVEGTTGVTSPAVVNAAGHYNGEKVDHFAYAAGLRRYFWDVWVDSANSLGRGDNPLVATNFKTADATLTMAQSALAGSLLTQKTFDYGAMAIIKGAADSPVSSRATLVGSIGGYEGRAKTGSEVTEKGAVGTILLSKTTEATSGRLAYGFFGEFGQSNYEAKSFIPDYGRVKGRGEAQAMGGGLFFASRGHKGFGVNVAIHGGSLTNDYRVTRDPYLKSPGVHSYRATTWYAGGQAGVSQAIALGEKAQLTPFLETVWTRTGPYDFMTKFGDKFKMEVIDSIRSRVGAKLSGKFGTPVRGNLTVAWEREYLGQAKGRLFKDPITGVPSLKGDSLFLETGLTIKPVDSPVSLNLTAFGRFGRQRDLGGAVMLKIEF
jgi:hypothetical protein